MVDTENLPTASTFMGLLRTGPGGLSSLPAGPLPPTARRLPSFYGIRHSLSGTFLENQHRNQADKR